MKSKIFNLLKPIDKPKTAWDRFYDWINKQAKMILMFVIIAITFVFIGKVIVDTEAKNYNSMIDVLIKKVTFFSDNVEAESRSLIKKADILDYQLRNKTEYYQVLVTLDRLLSSSSNDYVIRLEGENMIIYGNEEIFILKDLENTLKKSGFFLDIKFDNLAIDTSSGFVERGQYSLSARLDKSNLIRSKL